MFFEPPKVKSLSRYAEYGAYLGNRHFLMMLALAMAAHLGVIAIYSMMPSEKIIKIPVRVLNIKLSGGSTGSSAAHMPAPAVMPAVSPPSAPKAPEAQDSPNAVRVSEAEKAMDKALAPEHKTPPHPESHAVPPGEGKVARPVHKSEHTGKPEVSFNTPKKYVREADAAASKPKADKPAAKGNGNGSAVTGDAGGSEVISRYTQTISQWIKNHQDVAKALCGEMQQAQGQCNVKGQAVVRLRIDRDGHINHKVIERTSGNEMVDEVVMAMVNASDPLPAVPDDFPDRQLEFLIAVQPDLSKH